MGGGSRCSPELFLTTVLLFLSHGGRVEVAPFGERMPLHQWKMSGIAHVVNGTIMMNGEFVDTNASPPGHLGAGRFCPMHGSCIFLLKDISEIIVCRSNLSQMSRSVFWLVVSICLKSQYYANVKNGMISAGFKKVPPYIVSFVPWR